VKTDAQPKEIKHDIPKLIDMTHEQLEKVGYMCHWTDETKMRQNIYFVNYSKSQFQPTMDYVCSRKVVTWLANSDAPDSSET